MVQKYILIAIYIYIYISFYKPLELYRLVSYIKFTNNWSLSIDFNKPIGAKARFRLRIINPINPKIDMSSKNKILRIILHYFSIFLHDNKRRYWCRKIN